MTRSARWFVGILFALMLVPSAASAQSAISGLVTDTTGSVMPGVTVEATSPALIEKVRVVVTDGQGRYSIVDLRPGLYTVTFTLAGFSPLVRDADRIAVRLRRDGQCRALGRSALGIDHGFRRLSAGRCAEHAEIGGAATRRARCGAHRPHLCR